VGRTHTGAVREQLQPVGRIHIGEVCEELSPMRGTFTLEPGQSVRRPPTEGQGAAQTINDELTVTPIPHCPALLGARRERNGVELSSGRRKGWGEDVFNIWIYFSLTYSNSVSDELNSFVSPSSVCFVHDSRW